MSVLLIQGKYDRQGVKWMPTKAMKVAQILFALSPLVWIAQAALLSQSVMVLYSDGGVAEIIFPAALILLLSLLRAGIEKKSSNTMFLFARRALSLWRKHVFYVLSSRSPLDKFRPAAGQAANIIIEQGEALLPWVTRYHALMLRVMIVPPVILIAVFCESWLAAIILMVAAPVIPMFWAIIGYKTKQAAEAQWLKMGEMNAFLLDRLRGLKTLKALDAIDFTAGLVHANAQDVRIRTMAVLRIAFLSSAVLELFSALGVALVAVYIGFHLLGDLNFGSWGHKLSLGQGLFVLLLAPTFFEPLRELAAIWHDRVSGKAALESFESLSQTPLKTVLEPDSDALYSCGDERAVAIDELAKAHAPSVDIRKLSFSFADGGTVFKDLNLDISSGEHVALLGRSGSGKTVLMSLLAGLARADDGKILIDGVELDDKNIITLRNQMGWMGQRPHMFSRSIFANVSLNRAGVTKEAVVAALKQVDLYDALKDRLAEQLGEGGAGLSGGEIARLAVARIAVNPNTRLLLLDEPTAHLDTNTAQAVTDTLIKIGRGRTMIIATHDPSLAQRMDRIVSLEALVGNVVAT